MGNIKKYKTGEITGILEGIYNDPTARRTVVPLFMSDPGRGKTHVIRDFMKSKGCDKPAFVLSQRMPFEVSGMALVDQERQFMKYYDFDFFVNMKDGEILFCDETFNANPLTLSAFLTFLEDRIMISGKPLPNIMIVAAANPQGKPVITPQINRRFLIYDIVFDAPYWQKFMLNKYKMPNQVSKKLCELIKNENFNGYNYNTEADLDKATHMMIQNIETPYKSHLEIHLNTLIENKLKERVQLNDDISLEPGEKIGWLDMVQISKGIKIPEKETINSEGYWKVLFMDANGEKLRAIKLIKELTGFGLKESKDIMDNAPNSLIASRLTRIDAENMAEKFRVAGFEVDVEEDFN